MILLSAGLVPRGYRTRLLVGREGAREGSLTPLAAEKGLPLERLPGLGREIRPWSDLRALVALFRVIRRFRPHVVHTHTAKAGLIGRLAARAARVPVIVHTFHGHVLRGYFGPARSGFFCLLERRLAGLTHRVVAVSETIKRDLVELGVAPAERIEVIPLGLELDHLARQLPRGALRTASAVPVAAPLVGVVGRLVPIKDIGTFLKAAIIVRNSLENSHFAIVGDGPERNLLERQVCQLGLGEAVHFYGWRRDLAQVYGDLNVVVNCSLNEGTPVALIEALAAKKPIVATEVGGTPDLLAHGRFGQLVPPRDPESLAAGILSALGAGAEDAARKAAAGQRHVVTNHSVDRLCADVDALYRRLLPEAGGRP